VSHVGHLTRITKAAVFVSVFRWCGKMGEPTAVSLLGRAGLSPDTKQNLDQVYLCFPSSSEDRGSFISLRLTISKICVTRMITYHRQNPYLRKRNPRISAPKEKKIGGGWKYVLIQEVQIYILLLVLLMCLNDGEQEWQTT